QRGLRVRRRSVGARAPAGPRDGERQRRRDRPRPSARLHRCAVAHDPAARARAARRSARPGDHVLRRWARDGAADREAVTPLSLAELERAVGRDLGTGSWRLVDQEQVNRFADVTGDGQWIHVDPARAGDGPFGGTVAHGYLTLSLIPSFLGELLEISGG